MNLRIHLGGLLPQESLGMLGSPQDWSLKVQLDGDDLIFKNLAWLRLDVLAMGSSFTVRMVLEEALVRMVLTVLMLPLHGVSRSSSNLYRAQLQHHIMCNNKNAFASSVFPQCVFLLRASGFIFVSEVCF